MAAVFKALITEDPHCQSGECRAKGEEKGRGDEKRRGDVIVRKDERKGKRLIILSFTRQLIHHHLVNYKLSVN
jgi:hypothetical protein